jgi:regulator of replication initiation timing
MTTKELRSDKTSVSMKFDILTRSLFDQISRLKKENARLRQENEKLRNAILISE